MALHISELRSGRLSDPDAITDSRPPLVMAPGTRTDLLTLRMLGDNVTLYRCAWFDLLDSLIPGCELAGRIEAMLREL